MGKIKIISGNMRGKIITFDSSKKLRPTLGRIKETLFNWLGNNLRDLKVLDLFGGSGSLAFEANSRGATVTIVEKDKAVYKKIKRNIERHNMQKIEVHNSDAINFIRLVKETYDIIFLDPPFEDFKLIESVLIEIKKKTNKNSFIYIEHDYNINLDKCWNVYKSGKSNRIMYKLINLL